MQNRQDFPYSILRNSIGETVFRPMVPIQVMNDDQSVKTAGLVDSGADVNVLPYEVGNSLGLVWEEQQYPTRLSGNLAGIEARGVILPAQIGNFSVVKLGFAWVKTSGVRLILGQTNFFEVYNVCFYRTEQYFSVSLRS